MGSRSASWPGFLLLVLASWRGAPVSADVRITELLAANRFTNFDEEGDSEDWVELYNRGAAPVDLLGYGLSDRSTQPHKWVFPDVSIPAGGYLVVWASGKDRFVPPPAAISRNAGSLAFEPRFIQAGSRWRYLVADPAQPGPPPGWNTPGFDDSSFALGRAGFGYGDGDDATIVPENTGAVFTRRVFQVPEPLALDNLVLQIDYDDGFVAFLNGVRVAAANAPAGSINFQSVGTAKREAGNAERYDLTPWLSRLEPGENVLAVVGLNDIPSSDMSLGVELGVVPLVLHTNFSLNRAGETLLLADPMGELVDAVVFPEQTEDHSYGRATGGGDSWHYFLTPTPGAPNGDTLFEEPISDRVTFLPAPGKYGQSINVRISTTLRDLTEIRFTTDGSEPTPRSRRYTAPVEVSRNMVFRAAGFIGGESSTRITSSSYFIRSTLRLPIMSISMAPGDYATVHNNSGARGRGSERAAFMEYFDEDGVRVVATGLGMRLHGGAGRGGDFDTKKAYKVYFRGMYGDTKLRYRIIPDTPVDRFDKLVLRSGFNDCYRTNGRATYLRDQLIRDLRRQMGALDGHGTWCMLYVNMRLRGLFNIVERLDHDFLSSYLEGEDWDVIKTGNDVLDGSRQEWDRLRNFAMNNDLSNPALYEQFLRMIDIENFTSYMIVNMWAQNHDWPHNNWYAARRRVPGARWIFLCWDSEFGIGLIPQGFRENSFDFTLGRNGYIKDIFLRVLANEQYREFFMRELDRFTFGVLGADNVLASIRRLRDAVTPDVPEELGLFNRSMSSWTGNVNAMISFGRGRGPVFLDLVQNSRRFSFPRVQTPIVTSVSPPFIVNTGTAEVVLTGARFDSSTFVLFQGIRAPQVRFLNSRRLRATLPFSEKLAGPVSVAVVNPAASPGDPVDGLLEVGLPVPRVTSVFPAEGKAAGGDLVEITGNFFLEGAQVFFGDEPATTAQRLRDSMSMIVATTPPGTGSVEIRVVNQRPTEVPSKDTVTFRYLGAPFVRGDANIDGDVDISDAVTILAHLFLGDAELRCIAAADANFSRDVDLSDAISILEFLFGGTAVLLKPFPACGHEPVGAGLSCDVGPPCP
ncbi:MAG: CotH kinase family protein [Planctomycetota bacterium]|nr:CotH kinase family protein [Planctomycetota bacterium]